MSNQKVVLITGASSGVGQSTARLLAQEGYRVFGTSRNPTGAAAIPSVEMLPLDVRSDASVVACVTAVVNQVGRVDVLVNNAAYELAGALEETSLEEAKDQFETNFFGVVRLVRAVLPSMRGKGVAAQLLRQAEEEMRLRGCTRVTLDTTEPLARAMRFYEKNGYCRSGRVSDFFGMPLIEYQKTLP